MKNINKKGQGLMEYLIVTSLVGIICLFAVKQYGQVIRTRIDRAKSQLVKVMPN